MTGVKLVNTKKTKQLWNSLPRKVWQLPEFLVAGPGVWSWVRVLEEESDLGRGWGDRKREGTCFKVVD